MKKKLIIKSSLLIIGIGIIIATGIIIYLFNMPHRDVQASKTDYFLEVDDLISEYLADPIEANNKYLDESGNSKILEISGRIVDITEDFNNQKVVLLKSEGNKAGVSCTFTHKTNGSLRGIQEGQQVIVKGVIRSGASYDIDLQMYENVIMEKCDLISVI
jgi:hypothetical protein